MKKLSLVTGVLLCVATSCNKQLELPSDGRITTDQIFTDYNRTRGYLNSCYGYLPHPDMDRASYTDESENGDMNGTGSPKYSFWYAGNVTSSNYPSYSSDGSPWSMLYIGIRKCNVFIENMKTATVYASEEEKAGWVAQARTLRALYYLQLIKRYGGVPLLDVPLEIGHDFSTDQRASFAQVVDFILADCDAALAVPDTELGFHWAIYENQNGIMTRAVAYAIKSQAATYAASPLWSDGTYTWERATQINAEALSQLLANDYQLFDDQPAPNAAQNAYALYFITDPNDRRSYDKETIYQAGGQKEVWKYAGLPSTTGQEKSGPNPSQELVDAYEMANGQAAILGYADADHLEPIVNEASGYNPDNPYAGRDPRFYASIYYNGAPKTLGAAASEEYELSLQLGTANQLNAVEVEDYYSLTTTGGDPFIQVSALTSALNRYPNMVLSFEYRSATGIDGPELFFSPIAGGRSTTYPNIPASADWTTHTIDIGPSVGTFGWGNAGDVIRFDLGAASGKNINIRNIRITESSGGGGGLETFVGGREGISSTNVKNTRTGYYLRKFNNYRSGSGNNADGYIRLFRLAEVYLNFAESAYQSAGPEATISASGISMSARDAVNAVRARAGMPALPMGLPVEEFEKRYRNERRIELAFEEHRFFDVRRWKIMGETDGFVTGMRIERSGDEYRYNRFKLVNRNTTGDKWLMYPIDQADVDKIIGLGGENWQNPGWLD
ncbi:RagB/SusD family nutrient uptake outer membrane protein [Parapedobacter sp. DT-150]|uniref:RagB/SusD family nutrient uptake outer membrane protein n=1 Tax=Parapedobacter sp. DT-150 TaxID=3396162 RepID=UPI003F19985E